METTNLKGKNAVPLLLKFSVCFGLCFANLSIAQTSSWSSKMQEMSKLFPEIMLDVTSDRRFNDPKNRKRIEKNVKRFSELAHKLSKERLKKGAGPIDKDPSIGMLADLFREESSRAYQALKTGHRDYARSALRTATTYCISCHSRNNFGPNYPQINNTKKLKHLTSIERADLFAATRQFDRALTEYRKVISDKKLASKQPFEWQKAVKKALAISVRVKRNPDLAVSLLKGISSSPKVALFLRAEIASWTKSLREWKKEPAKEHKTPSGALAEAKLLISRAKAAQKYPADESGNVYYLRASTVLHDMLRVSLAPKYLAEAFLLSGVCYETMTELKMWTLPELYYESCIRKAPHTSLAGDCFRLYERRVYAGYSGSGGLVLPISVEKRIKELKEMALVRATASEERGKQ